jgi:hypothetical protein
MTMAKFDKETINRWASLAADYLGRNGYDISDVKFGVEAWSIAHQTGITNEAYTDRDVVDAHIVTALKAIFPNAVFKDRYSY